MSISATTPTAAGTSNPLIAGARVAGTDVYNSAGDHLGEIYDVMLDKQSGKVAYAIMSFGGFLGLGEKYHPIPWSMLDYDVGEGRLCRAADPGEARGGPDVRQPKASQIGKIALTASESTITTERCPTG